jgi:GNAT superfamily N-acetyltransferase
MSYDIKRLTTPPTEAEFEDIAVLSDHLTGSTVPRDVIKENVGEIVENPFQLFYVARDAGRIVGMTLLTLKTTPHERTAYGDSLVVHPDSRGHGIATQLRAAANAYADEHGITLQATTSRRRVDAWGVLQRSGYVEWDTRFIIRKPDSKDAGQ